jgi:hypothetical protein
MNSSLRHGYRSCTHCMRQPAQLYCAQYDVWRRGAGWNRGSEYDRQRVLAILCPHAEDEKHFGAACTGTVTVAICYVAGMNDWRPIALPLLVVLAYYLTFQNRA